MNWKEDGEVTSSEVALPQLIHVILLPADEKLAMAWSWQGTPFGHIDPICDVWLWQRVMYDLCTRPEQPEPAAAHTETGSREVADALDRQARDLGGAEDQEDKSNEPSDKAVHTKANGTTTSLLGKRHHSLYANLNGFEVEGVRKVSVLLLVLFDNMEKIASGMCLGHISSPQGMWQNIYMLHFVIF